MQPTYTARDGRILGSAGIKLSIDSFLFLTAVPNRFLESIRALSEVLRFDFCKLRRLFIGLPKAVQCFFAVFRTSRIAKNFIVL